MKRLDLALSIAAVLAVMGTGFYIIHEKRTADVTPPVLEFEEPVRRATLNTRDEYLLTGVSATDPEEGDVSDSILVEDIELSREQSGEEPVFEIVYAAFDSAGNASEKRQQLIYTDYHRPHFSLSQPLVFSEGSSVQILDYLTAEDVLDGDVTPFITIDGVDQLAEHASAGSYNCNVNVTNSAGDSSSLTMPVLVTDAGYLMNNRPKLFLKKYITYLRQGMEFNPNEYLDHVEDNGYTMIDLGPMVPSLDEAGAQKTDSAGNPIYVTQKVAEGSQDKWVNVNSITVDSSVNIEAKGFYVVRYMYTSPNAGTGQHTCDTYLFVVIE